MRAISFGLLAAAFLAISVSSPHAADASAPAPSARWHPIETTRYAWRKGGPRDVAPYTFIIEQDHPDTPAEEGTARLRVIAPGGAETVYEIEDGVFPILEGGLAPPVGDNLLRSKYLYLAPKLANARGEPALVVFGGAFASDPAAIRILALNATGAPYVLLSEETFWLAAIKDLDGDGVPEVVGYRSLSQTWNDCVKTYDPVSVFKFNAARDRLEYSEPLSRAYMKARGEEWAGPKVREDVGVSTCGANKGHIVKPPT